MKRFFIFVFILSLILMGTVSFAKHADLAGRWYTSSPRALKGQLAGFLEDARLGKIDGQLVGLIAPHAGYSASGPVAGYAYKLLSEKDPELIVLVGFSHRQYVPGKIAVFTDKTYSTPLAKTQIDLKTSNEFLNFSDSFEVIPSVFESENSIELEIPFLQLVAPGKKIVILALCDQDMRTCKELSNALFEVLKRKKSFTMIASSDMSHYLSYDDANKRDLKTISQITSLDPEAFYLSSLKASHQLMCGYGAVYSVMRTSKMLGADEVRILKYANSGDTIGDKRRVVGYVSCALIKTGKNETEIKTEETKDMLNKSQKEELLKIARSSINEYLLAGRKPEILAPRDELLASPMGAFVTLHKAGALRGCIGHMQATEPLYLTIRDMAIAAAVDDPRFPAVKASEMDQIDIEISVLSPMEKVASYKDIEIPKHGVMVKRGWQSGVYLPQVATETGWNREEFLTSLCGHKAGLPSDIWRTGDCELYVFTAEVFGEKELKGD